MQEIYVEFEVVVASRRAYLIHRWIHRYEAQVESGSHLPINGVGATVQMASFCEVTL